MSVYFKNFPRVEYKGTVLTDITRKADFSETIFAEASAFLPYTIDDDDRPEDIAFYYYGDVSYTWIVYLSNNIIDPYHEWPLSNKKFNSFLIKKYEDMSGQKGKNVIAWTQNTTITDNIVHYVNKNEPQLTINKDTFELDAQLVVSDWRPIRYYEFEFDLNESRRSILLLDKKYRKQAETELRSILLNDK